VAGYQKPSQFFRPSREIGAANPAALAREVLTYARQEADRLSDSSNRKDQRQAARLVAGAAFLELLLEPEAKKEQ